MRIKPSSFFTNLTGWAGIRIANIAVFSTGCIYTIADAVTQITSAVSVFAIHITLPGGIALVALNFIITAVAVTSVGIIPALAGTVGSVLRTLTI